MSLMDASRCLQQVANKLGWDNLTPYDFRHTFATMAKNCVPEDQPRLLMRHRHPRSHAAETV